MDGKCCPEGKELFTAGIRLTFGFWLGYVGAMKWISGAAGFVGHITSSFTESWAPAILLTALGWLIVVAEPVIGVWLLSGKKQKCAWLAASALMFLLTFGMTMKGEHATVANNWQYLVLTLACASMTAGEKKA